MSTYIDILKRRIILRATPRLRKVRCPECKMYSLKWDTFEGQIKFLDPATPCVRCLNCGFIRWTCLDKDYKEESVILKKQIAIKREQLEKSSRFKISIRKA